MNNVDVLTVFGVIGNDDDIDDDNSAEGDSVAGDIVDGVDKDIGGVVGFDDGDVGDAIMPPDATFVGGCSMETHLGMT